MSTTTSDAAALRSIAADLMEARRYVRSNPRHAVAMAGLAVPDIMTAVAVPPFARGRIWANLGDGMDVAHSDPLILEGHLYAAARLLQSIAGRLEKGADA